MKRKLKLGLLGTSKISKRVIEALTCSESLEVYMVASRNSRRGRRFAEIHQIPNSIAGYEKLLADPMVDIVYVSLPNSLHREWVIKAINRKKHVVCEKPIVLESSSLREIDQLANRNNVTVMEALWYRYHPQIEKIRSTLVSNEIGVLKQCSVKLCFKVVGEQDIRWNKDLGGGVCYDLLCYQADFLNNVLGCSSSRIDKIENVFRHKAGVDSEMVSEIRYRNGIHASLFCSLERSSASKASVICETGQIAIPNLLVFPEYPCSEIEYIRNGVSLNWSWPKIDSYRMMFEDFAEAVVMKRDTRIPLSQSEANLRLMEQIRSAQNEARGQGVIGSLIRSSYGVSFWYQWVTQRHRFRRLKKKKE